MNTKYIKSTSENELELNGIVFREKKETIKTSIDSGGVKTVLIRVRYIGDDYLKVTQTLRNGKLEDEKLDSNLSDEDGENFNKQWEKVFVCDCFWNNCVNLDKYF